jgi:2-C-methyl-D-erythritol 4-phosphate cytidylyltransferase
MRNLAAVAIIVAGGSGIRMGSRIRKQYLLLGERPVLGYTLLAFEAADLVKDIVLVVPGPDFDFCRETLLPPLRLKKSVALVSGGRERQDSVFNGLEAISGDPLVVIHDAVRPLVAPGAIDACVRCAGEYEACILGLPANDTLKRVEASFRIAGTLERESIWLAQTPQTFRYALIREAHLKAREDRYAGTDDASLVERLGREVRIIPGTRRNFKITSREDLALAEEILGLTSAPDSGFR